MTPETASHVYEFGAFTLDASNRLLHKGGEPVPLQPKALDLLLLLVERRGEVLSKDELLRKLWPDSFVEESNLSQNVYVLRKALGQDEGFIKTVPKRGYRFVAEVAERLGDGAELIVEEHIASKITVEESLRPEESGPGLVVGHEAAGLVSSGHRLTRRGRNLVIISLGLLLAGTLGAFVYLRPPGGGGQAAAAPPRSLAVLPFRRLGGGEDDEHLGVGLSDLLITKLSSVRRLAVRPTSAVLKYDGREYDAAQVGRDLRVDAVLEGSVQRAGGRVRVTVRLIDARDGAPLWAGAFDEDFNDIFGVEDSIAERVARSLAPRLSGEERGRLAKHHTENPEAQQLYLKGRFFSNRRTAEALSQAAECFERAAAADPNYALAYAGLAEAYALLSTYQALSPKEAMPKARAAAERAIGLDDSLAEPHATLAYVKIVYEWDWNGGGRELERALELNPNYSTARQWYASPYLSYQGRFDEALAQIRRAQEQDPLSLILRSHEGWIYYQARQYDQAIAAYRKTLELNPDFLPALSGLGSAYEQKGMSEEAITQFRKAASLAPTDISLLGHAYAVSGRRAEALKVLDQLKEQSERGYVDQYLLAVIHAGLGEKEQAFGSLQRAYEDRSASLTRLKIDPRLDALRPDPRFAELLRRLGLGP